MWSCNVRLVYDPKSERSCSNQKDVFLPSTNRKGDWGLFSYGKSSRKTKIPAHCLWLSSFIILIRSRWEKRRTSWTVHYGLSTAVLPEDRLTLVKDTSTGPYVSQDWTESEINFLTISRGAQHLPSNTSFSHSLTLKVYKRSAAQCKNKWYKLFPSNSDVNNAVEVEHLREMRKHWPGLYFHPQKQVSTDSDGHSQLIALHIVWPWSQDIMRTRSPSIFCDVTYETTVYHYKVVMNVLDVWR